MKWIDARSAIAMLAAVATVVVGGLAVDEMDRQEAAKVAAKEVVEQTEIKPVRIVPEVVKPIPTPEATPEPVLPVLIYDVPLDVELQLFIINECEKVNIDPAIVMAMAEKESTFKADAIGDDGDSLGLLQVQPRWHQERMDRLGCSDLFDPYQNVTVALDFLAEQLDRYNGDMAKALVGYNKGHFKESVTTYAKSVLETSKSLTEGMIEIELVG